MMHMNLKASLLISFLILSSLGLTYATENQVTQQEIKNFGNTVNINDEFRTSKFKNNNAQQSVIQTTKSKLNKDTVSFDISYTCEGIIIDGVELWFTKQEQTMDSEISKVEVTDINMPFFSMVWFMVKWAIASIPAIIILWTLFVMFSGLIGGLTHI